MMKKKRRTCRQILSAVLTLAVLLAGLSGLVPALAAREDAVLRIDGALTLPQQDGGYPSYPEAAQALKNSTDLTLTAQFMQTGTGIGSLFSASNASADAQHFHVYAYGGTLGYEMRGANGTSENLGGSASALRAGGVNTIAFVANSADRTFKLFANGALVSARTMDADAYHFISTIPNMNTVQLGRTARTGNTYPFVGGIAELAVYNRAMTDAEAATYTAKTPPKDAGATPQPFVPGDGFGSQYFRIPALYTLENGDVMAAADVRFANKTDSPNNLDTGVRFWRSGADGWDEAQIPNHFVDYADMPGFVARSASFIDPAVVQDPATGRIFILVDAWPGNGGIFGEHAGGPGMFEVDGEYCLGLTQTDQTTNWSQFTHYLKPVPDYDPQADTVKYTVCRVSDGAPTEYGADGHFNLYQNGAPLTIVQRNANGAQNGTQVPMSVFYKDSLFKAYGTSYLWLISSDDNGRTWSEPKIVGNQHKRQVEGFLGAGPGRGHVIKNGPYAGRILFAVYDEQDGERTSVLYSDDHGETWQRSARTTLASSNSPGKSSEAQMVELPDGTIRLFARGTAGRIGYADSLDGGATFEPMRQDPGLAYCGNCMISAINYSQPIDGKPAVLLSSPEGSGRNNGIIRIGLISENDGFNGPAYGRYSIEWKYKFSVNRAAFAYSCLTELENGDIGLLYEEDDILYDTYSIQTLKNGVQSKLERFSIPGGIGADGSVTAELTFNQMVVPALSALEGSSLRVTYPGSDLPETALSYGGLREDGKTLYYTGKLPVSQAGYVYRISLPEGAKIALLDGLFTPAETDICQGSVGDVADVVNLSVAARYSSNRLSWTQSVKPGVTAYAVQRASLADGAYDTIAEVAANRADYTYVDESAGPDTRYFYRLELRGGEVSHTGPQQAPYKTGLDALVETAVAAKVFGEGYRAFDGSRAETFASAEINPDTLAALKAMKSGTVILKARQGEQMETGAADRSILGSNLAGGTPNEQCFFGVSYSQGGLRLRAHFPTNRFNAMDRDFNDLAYHTAAFTQNLDNVDAGKANLSMEIDGGSSASFPNNLPMFFGDTPALAELLVGASKTSDGALAHGFVGDIAYVLVTDEQLSLAERQALTAANAFPSEGIGPDYRFQVLLSGREPSELQPGAEAGRFSVSASAPAGDYTYSLVPGEGDEDNAFFTVSGDTLRIAAALTEGETYSIRVRAENGPYSKEAVFEVYAMGRGRLLREEDKTIPAGQPEDLTAKPYASDVLAMEEGTIIVQYTSAQTGIQSLFSAANADSGKPNNHFHLYVMNGALGLEVRNANGTNAFSYGGADFRVNSAVQVGADAVNTVALKADRAAGSYKLFANGRLVAAYSGNQLGNGFKFISDIEGVNRLALGATYREGAPAYAFAGTVRYTEVYRTPLTDEELLRITEGVVTYPITVQPVSGASVSTDKTEAEAGETVTVAISGIETGKQFKSIAVTAEDGSTIGTQTVKAGEAYTFTMPAQPVVVTVILEPKEPMKAHVLNVQYGGSASLEVTGETDVILDGNGIYGAKVMAGKEITFAFTPVNGPFASAQLNSEDIPFTADGCTYTYTMPNENAILRFTFTTVDKAVLETLLEKANEVTDEQLAGLVPSIRAKFIAARDNAKAVYEDDKATQDEVNEAWKELLDAMHHLSFEEGTKDELKYWLDYAAKLNLDNFTPKSQEGYAEALAYAEEIYNDEGETLKAEVEKAAKNLQDAILRLEFRAKTETLVAFVKQAQEINENIGKYMDGDEMDAFMKLLPQAEALLEDANATQTQVDEMAEALYEAILKLRMTPDKEALKALIDTYEALDPADYTEASYAILRAALNNALDVYHNDAATPAEIAAVYTTAEQAYDGLVPSNKPEEPAKPDSKPSNKPSNSGGSGSKRPVINTSGDGTAVVTANPVISAAQNVMGQKSVRSDTTMNFTLKRGSAYCFKMTVVNGSSAVPNFTVGNGNVLKTQYVTQIGNDYYYRVWAVSTPGQSTGVYTTMPGEAPQQHCTVAIG